MASAEPATLRGLPTPQVRGEARSKAKDNIISSQVTTFFSSPPSDTRQSFTHARHGSASMLPQIWLVQCTTVFARPVLCLQALRAHLCILTTILFSVFSPAMRLSSRRWHDADDADDDGTLLLIQEPEADALPTAASQPYFMRLISCLTPADMGVHGTHPRSPNPRSSGSMCLEGLLALVGSAAAAQQS